MSSRTKPKNKVDQRHASTGSIAMIRQAVTQLLLQSNTNQLLRAMHDGTLWIDVNKLTEEEVSPADLKILGPTRKRATFDMSRGHWLLADFEGMSHDFVLEEEVEGIVDRVAFSNFAFDRLILKRLDAVSELIHWAQQDIEKSLAYLNRFRHDNRTGDYWTSGAHMVKWTP